jgi:hypothetical protein
MIEIKIDEETLKKAIYTELSSQGFPLDKYAVEIKKSYAKDAEYKVILKEVSHDAPNQAS